MAIAQCKGASDRDSVFAAQGAQHGCGFRLMVWPAWPLARRTHERLASSPSMIWCARTLNPRSHDCISWSGACMTSCHRRKPARFAVFKKASAQARPFLCAATTRPESIRTGGFMSAPVRHGQALALRLHVPEAKPLPHPGPRRASARLIAVAGESDRQLHSFLRNYGMRRCVNRRRRWE